MEAGIDDQAVRTVIQGLQKLGVRPLQNGMWVCDCKQCKRDRLLTQAELLGMRTLAVAFCTECLARMGVATMPVKPRVIVGAS